MKIIFVETPAPWLVRQHTQAPLGLLYLATILKRAGHEVRLLRALTVHQMTECADYDVAAFGGTTLDFPMVIDCVKYVRGILPQIDIWYGGVHTTAMIHESWRLLSKRFDLLATGEAEGYIDHVVSDWPNKAGLMESTGRYLPLDEIPYPDRTLLEGRHGGSVMSFHEDQEPSANMITSRGCPYRCAFCGTASMWGDTVRFRSAQNVTGEVREIVDSGISTIRFEDDNFPANKTRLAKMVPAFKEMNIKWHCSARAQDLDPETCEMMVEAGCQEVSVGVESGDQRVLDWLHKRVEVAELEAGCRNATAAGINVRALWMTGTPGERSNTPELSCRLLDRLPAHSHALATFIPLPGTPIWNDPSSYGVKIIDKDFSHYNQWLWQRNGNEMVKAEYLPLISNCFLTAKQQAHNVERMRQYVLDTGRAHPG